MRPADRARLRRLGWLSDLAKLQAEGVRPNLHEFVDRVLGTTAQERRRGPGPDERATKARRGERAIADMRDEARRLGGEIVREQYPDEPTSSWRISVDPGDRSLRQFVDLVDRRIDRVLGKRRPGRHREREQLHVSRGLCRHCKEPSEPGLTTCRRHHDETLARGRRRYSRLKRRGTCTACAEEDALPGRTMCEDCLARMRERDSAHYAALVAAGACPGCKGRLDREGSYCSACVADGKARHDAVIAAGKCPDCGRPAGEDRQHCDECAGRRGVGLAERYGRRVAARTCIRCEAPTGGGVRCAKCAEAERARQRKARDARVSAGLCSRCGEEPLLTETLGADCVAGMRRRRRAV